MSRIDAREVRKNVRSRSRSRDRDRHSNRGEGHHRQRTRARSRSWSPQERSYRNERDHRRKRDYRNYRDSLATGLDSELDNAKYQRSRSRSPSIPYKPTSVLRVENLPSDIDDEELSELFSVVPGVVSIRPKRETHGETSDTPCLGYAVLAMATVAAAQSLMESEWRNKAYYRNSRLNLRFSDICDPRSLPRGDPDWICPSCHTVSYARRLECFSCRSPRTVDSECVDPSMPSKVIKVSNLGEDVNEEDLEFAVKPLVPLQSVRIARSTYRGESRGVGFITFYSIDDAQKVKEKLDGAKLEGQRWCLRMAYSHSRAPPTDGGIKANENKDSAVAEDGEEERDEHHRNSKRGASLHDGKRHGVAQNNNAAENLIGDAALWEPKSFEELAADAAIEEVGKSVGIEEEEEEEMKKSVVGAPALPPGFDYDVNTGYYKDPVSGYLYDSITGYYFHPHQQQWGSRDPISQEFKAIPSSQGEVEAPTNAGAGAGAEAGAEAGAVVRAGEPLVGRGSDRAAPAAPADPSVGRPQVMIAATPILHSVGVLEPGSRREHPSRGQSQGQAVKGVIHRGKWAQRNKSEPNQ